MDGPRARRSPLPARPAKGSAPPAGFSVTELSFATLLSSLVADPRFPAAVAVACISGVVRGFSGFGSALIYVPLMAAIYEPRIAAVTLLIIDFVASMPFTVGETRRCNWREVAPVSLAAIATIPLGAAGAAISRAGHAALGHRNPGDQPAGRDDVGLALSRPAKRRRSRSASA